MDDLIYYKDDGTMHSIDAILAGVSHRSAKRLMG